QGLLFGVTPQPRLGDAADAADGALPVGPVLEHDGQVGADVGLGDRVVPDVDPLLGGLGDLHLHPRAGHVDLVVVGRVAVAQPGQHVGDRVGHAHVSSPALTSSTW